MPRYDYKCPNCHITSERFIHYHNYGKVEITCLDCGSHMHRVFNQAPKIQWSQFPGTTRYSDPRVEQGLQNERNRYGGILTDDVAQQINAPGDNLVEQARLNE